MKLRSIVLLLVILLTASDWSWQAHARCFPIPMPNPGRANAITAGYFEVWNMQCGLPSNRIRCILPYGNRVFVGTEGDGLMVFDGNSWRSYTPTSTPPFPSVTISALAAVPGKDEILAGTVNGLVNIAVSEGLSFNLRQKGGDRNINVLSLGFHDGTMFCGSDLQAGVVEGDAFIPLDTPAALDATGFSCLSSHQGVMRYGSHKGLHEVSGRSLLQVQTGEYDLGWVQGLAGIGSTTFVGGSTGLYKLEGHTVSPVSPGTWVTCLSATPGLKQFTPGIPGTGAEFEETGGSSNGNSPARQLEQSKLDERRRVLTETASQLFAKSYALQNTSDIRMDPAYRKYLQDLDKFNRDVSIMDASISATTSLLKGLWAGTQDHGAILMTADGKRREITSENSRLPSDRISAVAACENGEAWIGTPEAGLLHYRKYTFSDALPQKVWSGRPTLIKCIGEQVYIGTTDQGISIIDPRSGNELPPINEKTVPGFHREVTGIDQDLNGRLWTTGDRGVWMRDNGRWNHYTVANGVPDEITGCLEIDSSGRVYVTGKTSQAISSQLAVFNGNGFTSFSRQALQFFLSSATPKEALRGLGLIDSYLESFDLNNASEALKAYDDGAEETPVTAMLGGQEFLLLGTQGGNLFAFDGAKFRRIPTEGTGILRGIAALARRRNGDRLFLARNKVLYMDGEHFESVLDVPRSLGKYGGLAVDDRNPNLFWVGFRTFDDRGGVALYQEPLWRVIDLTEGVIGLTLVEPFVFAATDQGVWRLMR